MQSIKQGTMMQQVSVDFTPPINNSTSANTSDVDPSAFILMLLSVQDNIKAQYITDGSTICGSSWESFLIAARCSAEDVWPAAKDGKLM